MNPRVKAVQPNRDYTLTVTFANGEVKRFDVKPYLNRGIFQELNDWAVFQSVQPFLGSIHWPNGQDFCPDTLYLESMPESVSVEARADARQDALAQEARY